jgi:ATP-dependent phosphoenolpyruvate carboxykinase
MLFKMVNLIMLRLNILIGLNLDVPTNVDGVESKLLNPIETWKDAESYQDVLARISSKIPK